MPTTTLITGCPSTLYSQETTYSMYQLRLCTTGQYKYSVSNNCFDSIAQSHTVNLCCSFFSNMHLKISFIKKPQNFRCNNYLSIRVLSLQISYIITDEAVSVI
jgi:hypothetical protein